MFPDGIRRVLVTGAAGSIGEAVLPLLRDRDDTLVFESDITTYDRQLDVTDPAAVQHWMVTVQPTHILHLAGAKHAPEGELDPMGVERVNTGGTRNILTYAGRAKVILASTCKACDPETAYGASKLIAERAVLNAKGVVVRFYNVKESSGNVFRLWETIAPGNRIPVTDCYRYFISKDAAAHLAVSALDLPTGRYATDPGAPQHMFDVARQTHPNRRIIEIDRRRGDRYREPLHAASETIERLPGTRLLRITSPHDPT